MKFALNDVLVERIIGISMAAAVAVTVAMASAVVDIKNDTTTVTENNTALAENDSNLNGENTTVIPFVDKRTTTTTTALKNSNMDSNKLQSVYNDLIKSEILPSMTKPASSSTTTASTTITTTTVPSETTTVIKTSETNERTNTTTAAHVVSNGKREFNYDDVSMIAADLKNFEDFVEALNPTSFCWNTSAYSVNGCIEISLISSYGNITLDVKPVVSYTGYGQYKIDNKVSGSVNSSSITDWDWYIQNKEGGCNISSVTWAAEEFAIAPVRDVKLGASLVDVTESYLCVNGGATTLYKASDVIKEQSKLNALLVVENAYTFVGGRVYKIDSYLEKYYHGKEKSYRFADCDYVVQYGCNSIMDHNYATGSWIIEYAIKDDVVVGITFMNKSFYDPNEVDAKSQVTNDTGSTTSSTTAFEQLFGN